MAGLWRNFLFHLTHSKFNDQVTIAEILNTSRESKIGYSLDVIFLYPDQLHDAHLDYPLAPTKEIVSKMWLSELQLDRLKKMNISVKVGPYAKAHTKLLSKEKLYCTLPNTSALCQTWFEN